MESTFEGGVVLTPLTTLATIDDLIVALLRLGYKKIYREWEEKFIEAYVEENYKNVFEVRRVPKENVVRVFINHKSEPKDNVGFGDVCLTAEVIAKHYPYIHRWYSCESYAGSAKELSWEDTEKINIEEIDKFLDLEVASWKSL